MLLAHMNDLSEYYRGFQVAVGVTFVTFFKVASIVTRPDSSSVFYDIPIRRCVSYITFPFFNLRRNLILKIYYVSSSLVLGMHCELY